MPQRVEDARCDLRLERARAAFVRPRSCQARCCADRFCESSREPALHGDVQHHLPARGQQCGDCVEKLCEPKNGSKSWNIIPEGRPLANCICSGGASREVVLLICLVSPVQRLFQQYPDLAAVRCACSLQSAERRLCAGNGHSFAKTIVPKLPFGHNAETNIYVPNLTSAPKRP